MCKSSCLIIIDIYYTAQDYIYWVETTPNYRIVRIKRDLTGHEVVLSDEQGRITDIAVDWIAGNSFQGAFPSSHVYVSERKLFQKLRMHIIQRNQF